MGSEKNTSFEGIYSTWKEADALSNGYGNMDILEKVLSATMKVKNGVLFMSMIHLLLIKLNIHGLY